MLPNTIDQVPIRPCVTWPIVIFSKSIGQMPPCTIDQVTIGPDGHLIYRLSSSDVLLFYRLLSYQIYRDKTIKFQFIVYRRKTIKPQV